MIAVVIFASVEPLGTRHSSLPLILYLFCIFLPLRELIDIILPQIRETVNLGVFFSARIVLALGKLLLRVPAQ